MMDCDHEPAARGVAGALEIGRLDLLCFVHGNLSVLSEFELSGVAGV